MTSGLPRNMAFFVPMLNRLSIVILIAVSCIMDLRVCDAETVGMNIYWLSRANGVTFALHATKNV